MPYQIVPVSEPTRIVEVAMVLDWAMLRAHKLATRDGQPMLVVQRDRGTEWVGALAKPSLKSARRLNPCSHCNSNGVRPWDEAGWCSRCNGDRYVEVEP